jgi:hypothetical protein
MTRKPPSWADHPELQNYPDGLKWAVEFDADDWMACRSCGLTYLWDEAPPQVPSLCPLCAYAGTPPGLHDHGGLTSFAPASARWTLKSLGSGFSVELARSKRDRMASRRGWKHRLGGTKDVPVLASEAYRGKSKSGWLHVEDLR